MDDMMEKEEIEFELDEESLKQLQQMALDKGVTLDEVVEEILREFLNANSEMDTDK